LRSCSSPARFSSPRSTTSSPAREQDEFNAFLAVPDEVGEGIRLGVKDLFDTAGLTTTYGSAIFRDHVPDQTAEAVLRLEAAGYALVGKTNLHEFAYGITSENPHFGDVVNPLDPTRYPGGSSGGSAAALAAGLCDAALGTDSAGSIRIPAACCGIVGFKPTHALVPMGGCWPLAPSWDTGGPMARDVAGCVRLMCALDPTFTSKQVALDEPRVAVAWLDDADADVALRIEEASALFPHRERIEFPLMPTNLDPVFWREVAGVHRELFAAHADLYGENVRAKVERALRVADEDYEAGLQARNSYVNQAADALEGFDLLLVPTIGTVAPPRTIPERKLRPPTLRFTEPFNALGWPALALPCGSAASGLPASVTLAAPRGGDGYVLGVGAALEAALASAST
jgi:aspartyl-tRNA(Asn)/glutamyl-tRNA(Gln) amidotransferase subunit A